MKITINKVLLFLQAVLLLAGFPVVAMDSGATVSGATKSELVNDLSQKLDRLFEKLNNQYSAYEDLLSKHSDDENEHNIKSLASKISNIQEAILSTRDECLKNIELIKARKEKIVKVLESNNKKLEKTEIALRNTSNDVVLILRNELPINENKIDILNKALPSLVGHEAMLMLDQINKLKDEQSILKNKIQKRYTVIETLKSFIQSLEKEQQGLEEQKAKDNCELNMLNDIVNNVNKSFIFKGKKSKEKSSYHKKDDTSRKPDTSKTETFDPTDDTSRKPDTSKTESLVKYFDPTNVSLAPVKNIAKSAMTGASHAAYYAASKAKDGASKTIDGANAAVSYVVQTPVVQNSLVGTVVSLGKTFFNAGSSLLTRTEDYVRESVDLVGCNVEYNLFKKLEHAMDQFKALPEDSFGYHVGGNKDILQKYTSKDQKIRAMGAVIENMQPKNAIINIDVQKYIKDEQALYAPIKKALEEILSQSYAEISHKYTLPDALNNLQSKTDNTVKPKLDVCKNAIENYFDNLKNEKQKIVPKNKDEQAQIANQLEYYDAIKNALYQAADLYKVIFLIDHNFNELLKINTKYIDIAIDIYNDYVDWFKEYKRFIDIINETDFESIKKSVQEDKQVEFIINLRQKGTKSSIDIARVFKNQQKLLKQYAKAYDVISTIVGHNHHLKKPTFKQLSNHLNDFVRSEEFSYFTNAQQDYIKNIASKVQKECSVLDKVLDFVSYFSRSTTVLDVVDKHDTLEKEFKDYKKQEFKDHFADISVEELTVNRSEGIKKLVQKHVSVSKFIKLAEQEQAGYAKRQEKRFSILGDPIKQQINDLLNDLLNNDKQPTDEDLEQFDLLVNSIVATSDLRDGAMVYTAAHKKQLIEIVEQACQDAKNYIKVAIVAGWTVVGVEAKIAFEELANTNGSDAKSVVKRGFGKGLNAMRKGLIGTGNKIAEKEYHKQTRKEIKDGVMKAYETGKDAITTLAAEAKNSWDNSATDRKESLEVVKDLLINGFSLVCEDIKSKSKTKWHASEGDRKQLIKRLEEYKKQIAAVWDKGKEGREVVRFKMQESMFLIAYQTIDALDNAIEAIKNAKLADLQKTVKKAFEEVKKSFLKWNNGPEEIEMKNMSRAADDDSSDNDDD